MSSDLKDLAEHAAGNHHRFECFAWWDEPDDSDDWTIVYTHNRDSGILDQSNAAAIEEEMKPFIEDGTAVPQRHNHFLCGWIDGYALRVFDANDQITPAFQKWVELNERMEDYPVLDDDDLNRREHEDAIESIQWLCPSDSICGLPDDWEEEVSSWMWDHNIGDGYISEEDVRRAFEEFGWIETDDDESE
jgi:hypothetical protein